jgi:hypothetical protein
VKSLFAVGTMSLACLLAGQRAARAEPLEERASLLFAAGREAMKREDYPAACANFDESQRLDPSLGTVLNLAVCEERQGHLTRARTLLEQFLSSAPPEDDRRANAQQLASSLDARLPQLALQVEPPAVPGTRLSVDGREQAFEAGAPLRVDPGQHRLEVDIPGYSAAIITLELSESEQRQQRISLSQLPAAAAPTRASLVPAPPHARQALPHAVFFALGVGLAGAATAVESGMLIAADRATVREHCANKSCDPTGLAAGRRGKTLVAINTIAWPVAVAGTSLAAYLVLFRSRNTKQQYALGVTAASGQTSLVFEGTLR